ncbi:hypothetical protein [Neorhizobium sp. JUb45]|uniref:hypothetical protein n=1 Tax=Neorhizobium sp. JUb45 TaxID=2485113 RepID=UPI001051B015|nr:hypothetical protein [Neorhizobium sp. JUb45]TCR01101.1 hypothetical protein EDF70_105106 [Neorhizobium sp. JUb45]
MTNHDTTADMARRRLSLWFFRDLTDDHRHKLFRLFSMPDAEITNMGYQAIALNDVVRQITSATPPQTNVESSARDELRVLAKALWDACHRIAHPETSDGMSAEESSALFQRIATDALCADTAAPVKLTASSNAWHTACVNILWSRSETYKLFEEVKKFAEAIERGEVYPSSRNHSDAEDGR